MRENAVKMLTMSGVDEPSRAPKTLCTFDSQEALRQYATGCDADVGGTSTMQLSLDESGPKPSGKLWGDMKLAVHPELQGRVLGGYAGFRTMFRKNLFGEMMHDLSNHDYIGLRVRMRGSKRLKNSYFVNLQTEGYVTTDLWQHRLYFRRDDGDWEDVYIPISAFVLTNNGEIVDTQMDILRERVRSIGISLLGGKSGMEGPYELGIESIRALNSDDITSPSIREKDPSRGTQWQRGPL